MKKTDKRKVPLISQYDEAESGPASLCMILAAYGRFVGLNEMRRACAVSRDGCRVENLLQAASAYGLKAQELHCDAELRDVPLPTIALWEQTHWLVVAERTEKGFRLADPAFGKHRIHQEEFAKGFSGVCVCLSPAENFQAGGKPFRLSDLIQNMIHSRRGAFLFLSSVCFLLNFVGLMLPGMTRLFVDWYLPILQRANVGRFFLVFACLLALQALLLFLKKDVELRFQRLQSSELTGRVVKKILTLPLRYFQTRSNSTVISWMAGIDALTDFVSARLVPVVLGMLFSVMYIVLLFVFNTRVAAWTVAVILATIVFLMILVAISQSAAVRTASDQAAFYGAVSQTTRLFDTIKSVALEDTAYEEMMTKFAAWQKDKQGANSVLAVVQAVPVALPLLIQTLVVGIGGYEVIHGRMTVGGVLACQSIAMSVFAPIVTFVQEFAMLQFQKGPMNGLNDMLEEKSDPRLDRTVTEASQPKALQGDLPLEKSSLPVDTPVRYAVELRSVTFGYDETLPPVIEDISIQVPEGHSAAFVGFSGSGKSTVIKLLLGLYQPWSGDVVIGGESLRTISHEAAAAQLSVVSQSPYIFTGTVRENITLFDPNISMEELTTAASDACLLEAIHTHPGGFNASIAPTGTCFSGGEIQRMMIARALVRRPKILLMDEATSALDPMVEEQIMKNIRARGITLLIVAHRLSTIRDCNEILVLKNGRIAERGTHEQLLKAPGGAYRELIQAEEAEE